MSLGSPRRSLRLRQGYTSALAIGCGLALLSATARADKFDETLDVSLHARGSALSLGGVALHAGRGAPEPPAGARLVGTARTFAPVLRMNLSLSGFRFGVGVGVEGQTGLRIRQDLHRGEEAARITDGVVWGVPLEGFFGYAFATRSRVRPMIEARATGTFLMARVGVRRPGETQAELQRMRATTFGVAARVGLIAQINEYVFVDAGIGHSVWGPSGWTACVGLGLPIPLANL